MPPTEPAAIAALPRPPRPFYEDKVVGLCFVILASLGMACLSSLFAEHARATDGDVRAAALATLAMLVLGAILERVGAVEAWALITRALVLAPVWAATLFFEFFWPEPSWSHADGLILGAFLVILPVLSIVAGARAVDAARNAPRRSWMAVSGLALLWMIPFPSLPVEAQQAPLVTMMSR